MKRMIRIIIMLIWVSYRPLSAQTTRILDTTYTPPGYEDGPLNATVYIPAIPNGAGVVLAHYLTGTRQTLDVWCDTLAAHGYVAMTIDYYDWSSTTYGIYPKPVRAYKTAVEFLRRNAARFGNTSGKIAGLGKSEGSFHWGETIIWDNDDAYFHTDPNIDDHLQAVVLLYGMFDNNKYLQSILPLDAQLTAFFAPDPVLRSTKGNCIANARNITTPVLMFHGTNDNILQSAQSIELHDSLVAYGKACELVLNPSWDHGFDNTDTPPYAFTSDGLTAKDTVLAFLQRTLLSTTITSVEPSMLPENFTLNQNYPNPFNPSTTISFSLAARSSVTLKIFDVVGRNVATLVSEEMPAGIYSRQWNAAGMSSGVYFYQLHAGKYIETKKLIVLK
jgi:dienelactone hydrolase